MSLESLRMGTSSYFRKSIAKTASNGLGSSVQSCAGQCIDRDWPLVSDR